MHKAALHILQAPLYPPPTAPHPCTRHTLRLNCLDVLGAVNHGLFQPPSFLPTPSQVLCAFNADM
jgi:hypothetical protein